MLILASASPRRHELMRFITEDFEILAADIDESTGPDASPWEIVSALARKKAEAVFKLRPNDTIIGADTIVVTSDGEILGKPRDKADAVRMLRMLSGKFHKVFTSVHILGENLCRHAVVTTEVCFAPLGDKEIADYIETGEPFDKAGAYGIQGKGALFIHRINGDYYNVMGLPVSWLNRELKSLCII